MAQSKIRIKREPFFLNVDGWRSGVNLNDFTNTGAFALSTNLTNAPNGWTWVILFVIGVRYDTIEQMIFSLSGVQRREYRSGAWSSWKSMGGGNKRVTTPGKMLRCAA